MIRSFFWILHKDLVSEFRARRAWPTMLLLGIVVAMMFSIQIDLPAPQKQQMAGGMLWLAIFFAGMTVVDRSFAAERENGCWEGLRLSPVSASTVYLAKLAVNFVAMVFLNALLIPLFFVLSDLPFLPHAAQLALVAVLASLGLAAAGTLVSAVALGGRSGNLLVVLMLPLSFPVLMAAAECTRLAIVGSAGQMEWRWIQLLIAFATVYVTCGTLLFEYAIEE